MATVVNVGVIAVLLLALAAWLQAPADLLALAVLGASLVLAGVLAAVRRKGDHPDVAGVLNSLAATLDSWAAPPRRSRSRRRRSRCGGGSPRATTRAWLWA